MTICGGITPADETSDNKGKGEAPAAYCLYEVVSQYNIPWGKEVNVVKAYLLRSSNPWTVESVDMLFIPQLRKVVYWLKILLQDLRCHKDN